MNEGQLLLALLLLLLLLSLGWLVLSGVSQRLNAPWAESVGQAGCRRLRRVPTIKPQSASHRPRSRFEC